MPITRICGDPEILDVTLSLFIFNQQIIESDSYSAPSHLCKPRTSLFDKFISPRIQCFYTCKSHCADKNCMAGECNEFSIAKNT